MCMLQLHETTLQSASHGQTCMNRILVWGKNPKFSIYMYSREYGGMLLRKHRMLWVWDFCRYILQILISLGILIWFTDLLLLLLHYYVGFERGVRKQMLWGGYPKFSSLVWILDTIMYCRTINNKHVPYYKYWDQHLSGATAELL